MPRQTASAPSANISFASEALSPYSFGDGMLTGPRGALREVRGNQELAAVLQGVTSARIILHDRQNPVRVALRQGKNGSFGPTGGVLQLGEHPVECAIRETREETRVREVRELRFLTVQSCEGKGMWLSRAAWESWGYDLRGRQFTANRVWVANVRTAIFFAPLSEPFGSRNVEGRAVRLVDLSANRVDDVVRPMFRHLMRRWVERLNSPQEFPSLLRVSLAD